MSTFDINDESFLFRNDFTSKLTLDPSTRDYQLLNILNNLKIEFVEDEIVDHKKQELIQIAMVKVPNGFFRKYPHFKNAEFIKNRRVYYLEAGED